MDLGKILAGTEEPLPIYKNIITCLENIETFPYLLESIYRDTQAFDEDTLDRFRFALLRLQVYTDLHQYRGHGERPEGPLRRTGPGEGDLRGSPPGAGTSSRGLTPERGWGRSLSSRP